MARKQSANQKLGVAKSYMQVAARTEDTEERLTAIQQALHQMVDAVSQIEMEQAIMNQQMTARGY